MSNKENSNLDPAKATQMLKEMLHLGKTAATTTSSSISADAGTRERDDGEGGEEQPRHDSNRSRTVNGKTEKNCNSRLDSEHCNNDTVIPEDDVTQEIRLTGTDDADSFPVFGNKVVIKCSTDNHTSGSSKVTIKNIVNSGWENRYYAGQQVVVSPNGDYVAYTLKIPQSIDGVIRIVNWKTKQRELLRGMKGLVVDLAFANCTDDVLIASIDEFGSLFVHSIKCAEEKQPIVELILTVHRPDATTASIDRRVMWCHYIPDDVPPDDDVDIVNEYDHSKRLVVTHLNVAEVFNVDSVRKTHGIGPLNTEQITSGYLQIKAHNLPIWDATFSPDGTALATISFDGVVKFFQIYFQDRKTQRCIHEWIPHDGKPLSCLFFLDNRNNTNPDAQFWKFAVTGAAYNRELKIWNCASWICLQTIRFEVPEGATLPELKAGIDGTAEYLILSDVARRVLYVLNIYQDAEKNVAQVSCITEFLLTSPMLSFTILSASRKKLKPLCEEDQLDEGNFADNFGVEMDDEWKEKLTREDGVVIKLLYVQPKSLQECHIAYQPVLSIRNPNETISSFSMDSISFKDRLSDLSYDTSVDALHCGDIFSQLSSSFATSASGKVGGPLLLTPDVFSSPNNEKAPIDSLSNAAHSASKISYTPETASVTNLMNLDTPRESPNMKLFTSSENTLSAQQYSNVTNAPNVLAQSRSSSEGDDDTLTLYGNEVHRIRGAHSTGSSPSLEVQEILNKDLDDKDIQFIDQDPQDEVGAVGTLVRRSSSEIDKDLDNLITLTNLSPANQVVVVKAKSLSPRPTFSEGIYANNLVKWPTTPTVPPGYVLQHKEREKKEHTLNKSQASVVRGEQWIPKEKPILETSSVNFEHLSRSILTLAKAVETQNMEMQSMKQAIVNLDARLEASPHASLQETLQRDLNNSIRTILQKHRQAETSAVGNMLKSHEDKLIATVTQTVNNSLVDQMYAAIKSEIKNNVLPAILREMDSLTKSVNTKVTKKMSDTDALLKENTARLAELKVDVNSLTPLIPSSVHGSLRSIFVDVFQNELLPSFDKSCSNMFLQVDAAFEKGEKEYTQKLKASVEKQQHLLTEQMQNILEKIRSATDIGNELDRHLGTTLTKFEEGLNNRFSTLVQKEMTVAIREHQAIIGSTVVNAIKSRAVTPVPTVDRSLLQASILQHLQQGQLNSAFQQALSVSDLNVVMFVCEKVNPSRLFGETPCPLQQPVLLSLIHQLSSDLSTSTELKQEYLQEALVNLNLEDSVTNSHVPLVMDTLQQKLRAYIHNNPGTKLLRSMKMLLMASESVMQRRVRKFSDTSVNAAYSPEIL